MAAETRPEKSGPDRLLSTGWSTGSATGPRAGRTASGAATSTAIPTSLQPPQSWATTRAAQPCGLRAYASRTLLAAQ